MERYRENKVVGRGGFGEAFLCTRKSDAKTCIVKKISTSMLSPKQQEEARHEAVLLEGLSHPCIVGFVESFLDQDTLCIVMDFASCGDLGDYIRRRIRPFIDNFIDEQRILRWFVQITQALEYLHGKNILHRDLKPANIFLTETLTIKIGDFGISKVLEHTSKMANTCIGTPLYMAPELLEERPYDHKADIWGLGCILYEMARLKCPFENPAAILEEDPAQLPSRYSLQLRDLTGELLQKEPDARPSTSDVLERPLIKEMEVLMAGQRPDTTMETVEKAVEKGEKMVHNAVDDAMDAAKALAKTKTWKGKAAAAALSATAKLSATTKLSSKK